MAKNYSVITSSSEKLSSAELLIRWQQPPIVLFILFAYAQVYCSSDLASQAESSVKSAYLHR